MSQFFTGRRPALLMGLLLLALLVLTVPTFVCEPPFLDNDYYGLAARLVRRGMVLERDMRFMAPPGLVWARAAIDSLSGDRHEVLKLVDLAIALGNIALITVWVGRGLGRAHQLLIVFVLLAFYLGTPEVCHCQPDPWMFLPTLAAFHLRRRQVVRLGDDVASIAERSTRSAAEGFLCGIACLIKPHAMVPMLCIWLVADLLVLMRSIRRWKRVLLDAAMIGLGGGITLLIWLTWLVLEGGLEPLVHNVRTIGSEYYAHSAAWYLRIPALLTLFLPWSLTHLVAIPLALAALGRAGGAARAQASSSDSDRLGEAVFAAFYLGWTFQETFMQVAWMNHLLPPTMLALAICLGRVARWQPSARRNAFLGATAVLALLFNPLLWPHKLQYWPRCLREGGSPAVRDGLANIPFYPSNVVEAIDPWALMQRLGLSAEVAEARPRMYVTEWQHLDEVADFLRRQGVKDRELTCYSNTTSNLFLQLNLLPSTGTAWYDLDATFFPNNRENARRQLEQSPQRFIVSDLQRATSDDPAPPDPARPLDLPANFRPEWRNRYPWSEPIVFRAGRYAVHKVHGPVTPLTGLLPD